MVTPKLRYRLLVSILLLGLCACGEVGGGTYWDAAVGHDGFVMPDAFVQMDSTITADAAACVTATYVAEQAPLAIVVVMDKSDSMAQSNRWAFASLAIVQALDQQVFDSVHLGLLAAPSSSVAGPACVWGMQVGCGVPTWPQVSLQLAGTETSNDPTGVRREIKDWLSSNTPGGGLDGTPMYDALQLAYISAQGWPEQGKRAVLVVTDGSFSCTSLSSPLRNNFSDCNGCPDWEHPQNIVQLAQQQEQSATTPILTFVIGVPGSDTYDSSGCAQPPYYMRGALSSIAQAGAPAYVPASCDGALPFVAPGANPTESCHFDMTQGNFSVQAVADAISLVRGQTVGCTYALPDAPGGVVVTEVNVRTTVDGDVTDLAKRVDPSNPCDTAPGCWDYDPAQENVELIGAACDAVMAAQSVTVDVILGCQTIVM
jgi:hypothetical protein